MLNVVHNYPDLCIRNPSSIALASVRPSHRPSFTHACASEPMRLKHKHKSPRSNKLTPNHQPYTSINVVRAPRRVHAVHISRNPQSPKSAVITKPE